MHNPEQIIKKADITPSQISVTEKPQSTNVSVATAVEQDTNTLEGSDLFALFTANIIREERLFTR